MTNYSSCFMQPGGERQTNRQSHTRVVSTAIEKCHERCGSRETQHGSGHRHRESFPREVTVKET